MRSGVLGERALLRCTRNGLEFASIKIERLLSIHRRFGNQNLFAWLEEVVHSLPPVADDRRTASGGLKEASRGAVAHFCHGRASYIQGQLG